LAFSALPRLLLNIFATSFRASSCVMPLAAVIDSSAACFILAIFSSLLLLLAADAVVVADCPWSLFVPATEAAGSPCRVCWAFSPVPLLLLNNLAASSSVMPRADFNCSLSSILRNSSSSSLLLLLAQCFIPCCFFFPACLPAAAGADFPLLLVVVVVVVGGWS